MNKKGTSKYSFLFPVKWIFFSLYFFYRTLKLVLIIQDLFEALACVCFQPGEHNKLLTECKLTPEVLVGVQHHSQL